MSRFIVIHPQGDKSLLTTLPLPRGALERVRDVVTATRHVFDEARDAESYALDLARQNFMTYVPTDRASAH